MSDNPNFVIGTAALSWFDSSGQLHLRVYSTDGYTVSEMCTDGGAWYQSAFSAPASDVSATSWQDSQGTHLRVYCTFQDKTVEWCNDPGVTGWQQGQYVQPAGPTAKAPAA